MAIAVASTSTASSANSTTVVVTKPTGVASGDLLVIASVAKDTTSSGITCTGFTSGVNYYQDNTGSINDVSAHFLYRIADSTDVSAANYTVTTSFNGVIVAMFRITGWVSGNPVYGSFYAGQACTAGTFSTSASGQSVTRPSASNLLVFIHGCISGTSAPRNSFTFANHTVTTSGSSETTFTEIMDTAVGGSANAYQISTCVAYKTSTAATTVTGFSVDVTNGGSLNTVDGTISALFVINEPLNATPTSTTASSGATPVASSAVNDTSATSTTVSVPVVVNASTALSEYSIWTNPDKGSTTWTNPNK